MHAARMGMVPGLRVERQLFADGHRRVAGLDEVGRGALAGPVTVGVVVVSQGTGRCPAGLRDSKLLTASGRDRLVAPIKRWADEWSVGHASPGEIDTVGIMDALGLAARRALAGLSAPVDAVLLDGNYDYLARGVDAAPPAGAVHLKVKADRQCASVAAASVLAKTCRDGLMMELAERFPEYGWAANKGYGTAAHAAAIASVGRCGQHRQSWRVPRALSPSSVGDDGQGRPVTGPGDPAEIGGKVRDGRRER